MHDNEKKLVKDMASIVGYNIYSLAKELFETIGFSNEFVVASITKDGTISFGSTNMLHWCVVNGWVVHSSVCDYVFVGKMKEALENKALQLNELANT